MPSDQARPYIVSLAIFTAIILAVVAFGSSDYSWQGWRPDYCWPDECFCEALRPGPIVQPSNTYSSLGFVLLGLVIATPALFVPQVTGGPQKPIRSRRAYPVVYGAMLFVLGIGTLLFHASLTFVWGWLDVQSMFFISSFILVYNANRLVSISSQQFVVTYLFLNVVLGAVATTPYNRVVFGVILVAALVLEGIIRVRRLSHARGAYFYLSLGMFAVAFVIWALDLNGVWCNESSWLQGHAVWHILTAAACGLLFLYYRSERAIVGSQP